MNEIIRDAVLSDLQFLQANYPISMIRNAVAALPDPPDFFKTHRKEIVHLLLRKKLTLAECCRALGLPRKNHSEVARQAHIFCREADPKLYERGNVWHDSDYGYGQWRTPTNLYFLQIHAAEFLKEKRL